MEHDFLNSFPTSVAARKKNPHLYERIHLREKRETTAKNSLFLNNEEFRENAGFA